MAITYLPEERLDAEVVRDVVHEAGRRCVLIEGDLAELAFCETVVDRVLDTLGRLDVLVHNAAWQNRKNIEVLSEEELDTTMKVYVYAYLRLVRSAVPHMQPGASILATESVVGLQGSDRMSDYGATKGAIHAITKSLAEELSGRGIRVNCVAPGPVWTPLNPSDTGLDAEGVAQFGKEVGRNPLNRPAQPEELAPAYVFLASNADSSYITGAVLPVTGGPA